MSSAAIIELVFVVTLPNQLERFAEKFAIAVLAIFLSGKDRQPDPSQLQRLI